MKKIVLILLVLVLAASACTQTAGPEAAVTALVEAGRDFDLDAMEQAVSPSVREELEMDDLWHGEEGKMFQQALADYLMENNAQMEYEIIETEVTGTTAEVTMDFRFVDGSPVIMEAMVRFVAEFFQIGLSGEELTEESGEALFVRILSDVRAEKTPDFVSETVVFPCVRVDGRWYVDELSDDFLNVILSNLIQISQNMEEIFDSNGAPSNSGSTR